MKKLLVALVLLISCETVLMSQSGNISMLVMSYNIRYDNPDDGINAWDNRKGQVVSLIDYYHPDVFGLQEALLHQIRFLDNTLTDYSWVGVGRDDGKEKGEFSPVFFDTSKLSVIEWGTFWLSPDSDKPSVGWDAALPRICTWVRFKDLPTGNEIYFFNTHFDHRGEQARVESSKLIIRKISENSSENVILTGDFNQNPQSDGYKAITTLLVDSSLGTGPHSYGPKGTYSGFESGKELGERIDYIFISKDLKATRFRTITDNNGMHYPSDHLPVIAEISIK